MARPKMRRTMTRFRVLLMLALIGAVGLLTALYRFGAAGAPRPRRARSARVTCRPRPRPRTARGWSCW
ncbi:MAG TPA: hypothetical protein VKY89_13375, partial [Thermoanaerobaculia bacterium]|nr:hypothetical protein [Thermoanaerobaculia bacterium]